MDTFYLWETARFEIDPQKSHLGMPIHWLSAPFSGGASTEATFQGKPLRDWAIFEEEGSLSFFENELFSILYPYDLSGYAENDYESLLFFDLAAQEKVEFEKSCLYLSNEVFGVEDSSHLDSISISYQPDKNEAVYYQKVLMTPKAVTDYLENAKHIDINTKDGYLPHNLYYSIISDCSKEMISKFVEEVYRPTLAWKKAYLEERLQNTNHLKSLNCDRMFR